MKLRWNSEQLTDQNVKGSEVDSVDVGVDQTIQQIMYLRRHQVYIVGQTGV